MICEYRVLEPQANFNIDFIMEAESSHKVSYMGNLTTHPTLLIKIVRVENWDCFSKQIVYDLFQDNVGDCLIDQLIDAKGGLQLNG